MKKRQAKAARKARFVKKKVKLRAKASRKIARKPVKKVKMRARPKKLVKKGLKIRTKAKVRLTKRTKIGARKIKTTQVAEELVSEFLGEVAGPESTQMLKKMTRPITDNDLAEKLGVKVTVVRSALNKLYSHGVTSYERYRDPKTGWYTYTWSYDVEMLPKAIKNRKLEGLQQLQEMLTKETTSEFYICESKCDLVPFEYAMEYSFKCPQCQGFLTKHDNSETISNLKDKISKVNSDLQQLKGV